MRFALILLAALAATPSLAQVSAPPACADFAERRHLPDPMTVRRAKAELAALKARELIHPTTEGQMCLDQARALYEAFRKANTKD